jgi:hypothetical protein
VQNLKGKQRESILIQILDILKARVPCGKLSFFKKA